MTTTRVEPPPPATYTCVLDFPLELRGAPCRLLNAAGVMLDGAYRALEEPDYGFDVPRIRLVGERAWWSYVMRGEYPAEVTVWPATHVFTLG